MTLLEYFFKAFDFCRAKHGWSNKKASEVLGISENDLSRFRNGKRGLNDESRREIAGYLGYSLLDFLILGRELAEGKGAPDKTEDVEKLELYRKLVASQENELQGLRVENAELKKRLEVGNISAVPIAPGVELEEE